MRDSALFHIRRKANISLEHSLSVLHRHTKPLAMQGVFQFFTLFLICFD